ncbi:hypothetical protein TNCV_3070021 [Trichonephila clavipes]|nr:hypothetical protein TNCV_3070021 [Trichonephila clavipes]
MIMSHNSPGWAKAFSRIFFHFDPHSTTVPQLVTLKLPLTQKTRQHLMDPCCFRCCGGCPRLHPFHHRQCRVLVTRKSQSRHNLAFGTQSLMPSRFLHFLFIAFLKSRDRLDKEGNILPMVVVIEVIFAF